MAQSNGVIRKAPTSPWLAGADLIDKLLDSNHPCKNVLTEGMSCASPARASVYSDAGEDDVGVVRGRGCLKSKPNSENCSKSLPFY